VAAYYQDTLGRRHRFGACCRSGAEAGGFVPPLESEFHWQGSVRSCRAVSDGRLPHVPGHGRTAKPTGSSLDDASKLNSEIWAGNQGNKSMKVRLN